MRIKVLAALAATIFALTVPAKADDYPSRSMTMIIPFAAGGPTDVLGRMIAGRMSEILHQNVIVENINGAGGQTGSLRVANSTPDGYEFVLATVGTHAQGQTLYQHPLYDAATDFTPVILIANVPLVLVARKDLPIANFKEFVAYTKENQAMMQFGSAGTGSATHLGCLLMNYLLKVNVTHVPYRGSGPAMQDLQGGRIDYLCDVMTTAKPPIDSGAVKGLAVLNAKRSPALPDVATAVEQGMPDLIAYTWNAIFLPKNARRRSSRNCTTRRWKRCTRRRCATASPRSARKSRPTSRQRRNISATSSKAKSPNGRCRLRQAASRWNNFHPPPAEVHWAAFRRRIARKIPQSCHLQVTPPVRYGRKGI